MFKNTDKLLPYLAFMIQALGLSLNIYATFFTPRNLTMPTITGEHNEVSIMKSGSAPKGRMTKTPLQR
jgi:hypothetical protein